MYVVLQQLVYASNSPPNWKASTIPGLLMLLKTGSLSGEMGGGGGLWQGDRELGLSRVARGVNEKAEEEDGGGDTLPRLLGGDGVSALDPGPGRRHRGRGRFWFLSCCCMARASSALWMKWQRGPYGQKPTVWNVRHNSVLYLGCRARLRSSWPPCAN